MDQPERPESIADGERPGRIIVPGEPAERGPDEDAASAARDLGSASRSCLVIIAILLALVLFACVALVARSLIGG